MDPARLLEGLVGLYTRINYGSIDTTVHIKRPTPPNLKPESPQVRFLGVKAQCR